MTATRRFALIDRDGTINVDKHFLSDPDELELIPGSGQAIARLNQAGWGIIVVTNQSGIGRGKFDLARVELIHAKLHKLLAEYGAHVDDIEICPHGPDQNCLCRKPLPGLVEKALNKFDFDPEQSVMIGDKEADVGLGHAIGAKSFLVRTGYGSSQEAHTKADYVVDNLACAVDIILAKV
jgi:D-glycero-D-manno-heptose 1,7-bisphosphate phosphatase